MRTLRTNVGLILVATLVAVGLVHPEMATAAESSSYKLYSNYPNDTIENGGVSTSYTLADSEMTWEQKSGISSNYKLVVITENQVASSVTSSAGGTTGGSGGGSSVGHGNRRPRPPSSSSRSSSSVTIDASTSSISSSMSSASRESIFEEEIFDADRPLRPAAQVGGKGPTLHFFDAVDTSDCVITPELHGEAGTEKHSSVTLFLVVLLLFGLAFIRDLRAMRFTQRTRRAKRKSHTGTKCRASKRVLSILLMIGLLTSSFNTVDYTYAAATVPSNHAYNGRLLDSGGNAVTTEVSVRFSYWTSTNYASTDVTATGAINVGASTYAGWYEVQNVTPDSTGRFSLQMGSGTALPDFSSMSISDLVSLYLQVEVKGSSEADTAYELLDIDSTDDAIDRSGILSVPFAENADTIDLREIGTGSGDIAILGSNARLPDAVAPDGTSSGTYVIDSDDSESASIVLQFGTTLAKKLTYDISNTLFEFNDDVKVSGNLTVTGLINGVDVSTLQSSTGALKALSGGGLTLNIADGSYRLNGTRTDVTGDSVTMTANTTNYVFYGSGGLTVNTSGFPSQEAYIPIAEVTTNAGAITSVDDRRALSSDDREHTVTETMIPEFEYASYQGDASNNVGQLSISHDSTNKRNFYLWTSTRNSLQDYDMYLKIPLSDDFIRWVSSATENPLTVTYRSTSASSDDNQLDISLFDTNGSPVTLSGSVTDLADTSWSTTEIEFTGSPTWTAGQELLLKFTVAAKDSNQIHIGGLSLKYVDLLQ